MGVDIKILNATFFECKPFGIKCFQRGSTEKRLLVGLFQPKVLPEALALSSRFFDGLWYCL
jgi:hypothetical protein